ncbi:MAG: hypothetical protein A2289_19165 [Deltaproteobacteria bacterium RIFOXYA12_FULL_58_15]|nr:MAG: hypothetical protein A2289_19165 [Deltaproteobacteria bacterium RIFOXYA12_FULL_58_15]OGR13271.1 MAG: hypothetical protein A2341_18345 [Deltaproteobacteria bacterium RIFOXYB12_FULL_58_9]
MRIALETCGACIDVILARNVVVRRGHASARKRIADISYAAVVAVVAKAHERVVVLPWDTNPVAVGVGRASCICGTDREALVLAACFMARTAGVAQATDAAAFASVAEGHRLIGAVLVGKALLRVCLTSSSAVGCGKKRQDGKK